MVGGHKRRTLRGQFIEGTVKRLIIDDGRLNHGYKVVNFVISAGVGGTTLDSQAVLSLDYDSPATWNWGDNRQIGWASQRVADVSGGQPIMSVLDPDHVVIMDLYIQGIVGSGGGSDPINYLIELETVELTDQESILTLIKERSQDDPR
jgi:hypothetical protein